MNVEIEGLLRVLRDRDNDEARHALADKVEAYTSAMNSLLSEGCGESSDESDLSDQSDLAEVKTQEAEETEVVPEAVAAESAVASEVKHSEGPNTKLLKAFTLNDRFRFRRELFEGDDADFTETLKLLADMDSYAEACDYLYNDMMWDKTDPNVADFMAIVAANMPQ